MEWTAPVSALVALAVVVTAVGALVTLVVQTPGGENLTATAAVVALLVAAVLAMVALGALVPGGDWLKNSGYW